MGVAIEWFSEDDRRSIAKALLTDVDERNGKVWAACPFHAEQSVGGAFRYDPEKDRGTCYSCRASEDLVGIFCAVSGFPQNDPEGFQAFRDRFAPGRELHHGNRPAPSDSETKPAPRVWIPSAVDLPDALWSEKANAFVRQCAERLMSSPSRLERLAAWGIDRDTAAKCRMGWNDKDRYPLRTSWGLPFERNKRGKEKPLWLPEGLVLPFYAEGRAARLKIRRPHPERGPEACRKIKYYKVPGGCERMFVYGRTTCRAWVVVEAERDAAMIWGKVRDLGVGAIGTGSASNRPDAATDAILTRADIILVALDFDHAGAAAWDWRLFVPKNPGDHPRQAWCWSEAYPLAVRWPAPPEAGKDVGDAVGPGLDVRAWVVAGLPQHVRQSICDASRRRLRQAVADARDQSETISAPEPVPEQTVAGEPLPVATSEPFPDIPGLDFRDPDLADLWNLLPPDYPGKRAYFSLLGMFSLYPARGGRVRNRGDGPELDGAALWIDESWRRSNPDLARKISQLFWGEAWSCWRDWSWNDAPVEIRDEEQKVRACGAA
ncbi:hypothetical protein DesfrDRAFT_0128 [Solidesulfovibrio fructosivorans JJ]]|uniref:Zinc finger CHC2-type domain-containing protein n=1 Tax=Solidesulfovibrio fructosivorans JJ] TaxID=596151 RepID=E1JR79_SOLFR|nr:hypothetical protein [Solidesulfovibrio fructosivorans]EFL53080.1 hypothetical protein DesfrDRAFT_0128 [Solidesulfovibrio fructosivorans JJ]]